MTALLAVHVSTSVLRVQFLRVRSIQSTQSSALTAVLVQVFVLQRLSTRVNKQSKTSIRKRGALTSGPLFCKQHKTMNKIVGAIIKHAIIIAVAVACYFIYTELIV